MSIDILKEQLKNSKIDRLYLFYGQEEFLKKYYLDAVAKCILREEARALNYVVTDGKIEARRVMDSCETVPVFSDRKMVVVKNSGFFKSRGKGEDSSKSKGKDDDLQSYLQKLPEYVCLIFYENEIDRRTKLFDTIKKNGTAVEFDYQKPAELMKWSARVFKSFGKTIDPAAASLLVENSEQGMTEIYNEIRKAALYTGERSQVTAKDIEAVCTRSIRSRIFDLTDAMAERNRAKALALLEDMAMLKEPMPRILYMIARQFRLMLEMKLLTQEGLSHGEAAKKLGLAPYAAGKIAKQTGSFAIDTLKKALQECLEMDEAIKTGKISDRIAAELLIVKFCSK